MVTAIPITKAYIKNKKSTVPYGWRFYVKELILFSTFILQMLWAFPVAMAIRWKLRKNKKLAVILKFEALQSVRSHIEKGSFAYDALLFKVNIFELFKNKTHIANLVCLAIIIGDEYIDGLAQVVGKANIAKLLQEDVNRFYLKVAEENEGIKLNYKFTPEQLFDSNVLATVNAKYRVSYKVLYSHLLFLLDEINIQINKLPKSKQMQVASLISEACNNCFDTYIEDITETVDTYSFAALEKYQKRKDDAVVNKLLQLRACLLGKADKIFSDKFNSWSAILRTMQLYDDMQDIVQDYTFQKNSLAYYAKNKYPLEWKWLTQNEIYLSKMEGALLHKTICMNMPCAVMSVMQQAQQIAYKEFDWVQLKIQNYLWRKNWLCIQNGCETKESLAVFIKKMDNLLAKDKYNNPPSCDVDAHKLQMILMHKQYCQTVWEVLSLKERYLLKSCYVELPNTVKQMFYKKIISKLKM